MCGKRVYVELSLPRGLWKRVVELSQEKSQDLTETLLGLIDSGVKQRRQTTGRVRFKNYSLGRAQWGILVYLNDHRGFHSPTALGVELHYKQSRQASSWSTPKLQRMHAIGLVKRNAEGHYAITKKGRAFLRRSSGPA